MNDLNTFQNPFSINRAEHMGENLYRYFAGANLFAGKLSKKSLVLQGGRGSGKTMFFMYHSYHSKKREHYDKGYEKSLILKKENILGIYFKAEPDVVTGFQKKGQKDDLWLTVFGHYFNVTVCRSMCQIAGDLEHSGLASFNAKPQIIELAKQNIPALQDCPGFAELQCKLESLEDEVLLYINNVDKLPEPLFSHHSHGMKRLAEILIASMNADNLVFHVFVDEYENLLRYQQEYINSLIKNPSPYLVFDIGVRLNGFKTKNTLAKGEQIGPDDYLPFNLEEEIDAESYQNLIREICSKRLRVLSELSECSDNDARLMIDTYLGNYSMDKEVELLTSRNQPPPYLKEIEKTLRGIRDEKKREALYAQLTGDQDPLINRLNLVLLLQKKKPKEIVVELEKHRAGQPSKYKNWLHNYGIAAIFLMCRDYRQRKRYFGFDTFIQLSSGIPRYFIQLCFYSFDYAHQTDGFTFGTESTLSINSQDRAAYQLSHNKVDEIDTYPPLGHKLKRLALVLGRVFEQLHKRPNIGEPETNHFYTDYNSLSPSAREVIDSGVMWAVFQSKPLTKIKSSRQHRGVEYHLNHVYAPYFQISPRKKRRLDIKSVDFNVLVDGEQDGVAKTAQKLIGRGKLVRLADLLQWEDMQASQMDLWGHYEGQ